jgi:hypothetical protein
MDAAEVKGALSADAPADVQEAEPLHHWLHSRASAEWSWNSFVMNCLAACRYLSQGRQFEDSPASSQQARREKDLLAASSGVDH